MGYGNSLKWEVRLGGREGLDHLSNAGRSWTQIGLKTWRFQLELAQQEKAEHDGSHFSAQGELTVIFLSTKPHYIYTARRHDFEFSARSCEAIDK